MLLHPLSTGLGVSGALSGDGSLYLWGFGEVCQLGRSSEDDAPTPVRVPAAGRLAGHKVMYNSISPRGGCNCSAAVTGACGQCILTAIMGTC